MSHCTKRYRSEEISPLVALDRKLQLSIILSQHLNFSGKGGGTIHRKVFFLLPSSWKHKTMLQKHAKTTPRSIWSDGWVRRKSARIYTSADTKGGGREVFGLLMKVSILWWMAFAESAERSGRQQSQATGFQAKNRAPRLITKYTKMNSMAAFSPFIQHSLAGVGWTHWEYNSTTFLSFGLMSLCPLSLCLDRILL